MIRINRKLFAISLLIIVAIGGGVAGVRTWQLTKQSKFYFDLARKFQGDGDLAGAVNQLRRGLALEPKNFEAQWELANALDKLGLSQPAYLAAQKAEQLRLDDARVQKLLGKLALENGRFEDAEKRATKLLADDPSNSELLLLRARARFAARDFDNAILDYRELISLPTAPLEAFVELSTILTEERKQFSEALQIIEKLLSHPDAANAALVHGTWMLQQYTRRSISTNLEGMDAVKALLHLAQADADRLQQIASDQPTTYAFASRVASLAGDSDAALELIEKGLQKAPDYIELYSLGASTASSSGKLQQAERFLKTGLQRAPTDSALLWELASLMLEKKSFEEGRQALVQLANTGYEKALISFLEARFLAGEGKHLEAIKQFEAVRASLVNSPELQRVIDLDLANAYEATGNRSQQIAALRRAVSASSGWLAAREQLAIALLAAGRIEEATEEYRSLANRPGVPIGAPLNLARLMVMQNLARDPSRRDWPGVEELLSRIEEAGGSAEEITVLRAESLLAQNKVIEARNLLQSIRESDRGLAALVLLEVNQGDLTAADEILKSNASKIEQSREVRRAALLRWLSDIGPTAAETLNTLIVPPEAWPSPERIVYLSEAIPVLVRGEAVLAAKIGLSLLDKLDSTNLVAKLSQLEIASQEKNTGGMLAALSEIEKISGRSATWYYGQALAAVIGESSVTRQANTRAQAMLAEAAVLTPDWADVPALSGQLHDMAGDTDTAIVKYTQALDLGWRRLETIQRMLSLLAQKGRYGEADTVIRRASQANPSLSSSMSRMASEISAQLANMQRAVALAQDAAEKSQTAKDYVWLAQLRDINRETEAAEAAYRKARELEPQDATIQVAWIRFLSRTARLEQARQAVRDLETQIDFQKSSDQLMLAECFASLGMQQEIQRVVSTVDPRQLRGTGEHRRFYELLARISPAEERMVWLKNLLENASGNKPDAVLSLEKPEDSLAAWARRQLALEWISAGKNYEQAKQLLLKNLEIAPKSWEDRRGLAILLAVTSGVETPQQSISLFESLLAEGWQPQGDDGFFLGELYVRLGDWAKGSRYFLQVLGNPDRRQPRHLKRYATLLLSRKDPKEAELWVDKLQQEGVQDAETANLLTEVRYQRKQWGELLDGLIGDGRPSSEKDWFAATLSSRERYELASAVVTRLKSDGQTELFERFLPRVEAFGEKLAETAEFPGAFYATQLLSRGETKRAISAMERAIGSTAFEELAAFVETLLSQSGVESDDYKRLETMVRKSDGFATDNQLKVIAGRLCEQRGDFSGAKELYRAILSSDPNNAVALNNLANLLALTKTDLPEALQLIERSIQLSGETPILLDTRAICRLAAGDTAGALMDMQLAVGIYPHPLLRFHLAWVYMAMGDNVAAKKQFSTALEKGLEMAQVHVLERPVFEQLNSIP